MIHMHLWNIKNSKAKFEKFLRIIPFLTNIIEILRNLLNERYIFYANMLRTLSPKYKKFILFSAHF